METFGILLAPFGAFLASLVYCWLMVRGVLPRLPRNFPLRAVFALILLAFAIEVGALSTIGVVRARTVVGPAFYALHKACFFLVVPALANLLILRNGEIFGNWYTAPFACAVLALAVVFVEYAVYEGLYGIDGAGGPFGTAPF